VRGLAFAAVEELDQWLARRKSRDRALAAHYAFARYEIDRLLDDPAALDTLVPEEVPPGSPIGTTL
jgi:hypothetical protein